MARAGHRAKSGGTARHALLGAKYLGEVLRGWPFVVLAPLCLSTGARRELTVLLSGCGAWLASFLNSGGDFYLEGRFAVPVLPVLTALALSGVVSLASRYSRGRDWFAPLALATSASVAVIWVTLAHDLGRNPRVAKVERFVEVAKFLHTLPPSTTVATTAIGAVSYYSGLRVYDLVGLTNRAVGKSGTSVPNLARGDLGHERHDTDWVLAQKPDLVMTLVWQDEPFARGATINSESYAEHLLLEAVRAGKAPYVTFVARVAPDLYWLSLAREDYVKKLSRGG